jgi:hypothetical protein
MTAEMLAGGILLSTYLQWSVALSLLAMPVMAAVIADAKGRSAFGFFVLGVVLPIVGLIMACALPKRG